MESIIHSDNTKSIKNTLLIDSIQKGIDRFISLNKFSEIWFNYIYVIINNDFFFIRFLQYYVIKTRTLNIKLTELIDKIFDLILTENIIIDIKLFPFLLNKKFNINLEDSIIQKLYALDDLKFTLDQDVIIFYVKYKEILRHNIRDTRTIIDKLSEMYQSYEEYQKILFIYKKKGGVYLSDSTSFNSLQKGLLEKGYWLDIRKIPESNENNILDKYDIIITDWGRISDFININSFDKYYNKLIIIIPSDFSHDHFMYIYKDPVMINFNNKKNTNGNRIILGKRYLDNIESIISTGFINHYILPNYSNIFLPNIPSFNTEVLMPDKDNNNFFLNKDLFYSIYNLDNTKKLITIFLLWPNIQYTKILNPRLTYYEHSLYCKNSILIKIIDTLRVKYNVIIKLHPKSRNSTVINNKMYINKDSLVHNYKNIYNNNWGIKYMFDKFSDCIVDLQYHNEILTYTDIGFIFYPSTVTWSSHLYDFPMIQISTKDKNKDWFPFVNLKPLLDHNFIESSKYRNILKIRHSKEKLFNLKDIIYGEMVYIEDIQDNLKSNLDNLINKQYNITAINNHRNKLFENRTNGNNQIEIVNKLLPFLK